MLGTVDGGPCAWAPAVMWGIGRSFCLPVLHQSSHTCEPVGRRALFVSPPLHNSNLKVKMFKKVFFFLVVSLS